MSEQAVVWEPNFRGDVARLVREHRALPEEPLLLAVHYEPAEHAGDVHVFEVVDNFGSNSVDADGELFEVSYDATGSWRLPEGRRLRLVLTNPLELEVAAREGWPSLLPIRRAIREGRAEVVWAEPGRPEVLEWVHG